MGLLADELPGLLVGPGSYSMATKSTLNACFARNARDKRDKHKWQSLSLKIRETVQ